MAATMFERYGGFAKVSRIVSEFYDRVLDSPVLSPYFAGTDMRRLIDHQTKFVASVMGGPVSYSNEALERVHTRLNIDQEAMTEMVTVLRETLEDFGLEEADIALVCDDVMSRSRYIVSRR